MGYVSFREGNSLIIQGSTVLKAGIVVRSDRSPNRVDNLDLFGHLVLEPRGTMSTKDVCRLLLVVVVVKLRVKCKPLTEKVMKSI